MKKIGVKKSKLKKKNKNQSRGWKWQRMTGIFLLFVSLVLLFSFISYLYTWKVDQDKVLQFSWNVLLQSDIEVSNWLGRLGAIVSNQFFYWWIGVTSFLVPIYGIGLAVLFYFGFRWDKFFSMSKYLLLGVAILPLLFRYLAGQTMFSWGGAYGEQVITWLLSFMGGVGTFFFLFLLVVAFIAWHVKQVPHIDKVDTIKDKLTPNLGLQQWLTSLFVSNDQTESVDKNEIEEEEIPTEETSTAKRSKFSVFGSRNKKTSTESSSEDTVESEKETTESNGQELELTLGNDIEEKPTSVTTEDDDEFEIEVAPPVVTSQPTIPTPPPSERTEMYVESDDLTENLEPYDPTKELSSYDYPKIEFLVDHGDGTVDIDREELNENKNQIVRTLEHYKIKIEKIKATIGPTITLYEIIPEPGVRISKIKNLEDDIALSLAALGIRIIAPMPGKGTIGIEVPNKNRQMVGFREVVMSDKFANAKMELPVALGKTISNEVFVADLAKMPHLLVAGATGQGKSVGINTILASLLYKKHPSQLKLVLIDPKKVELFPYTKLMNHFLAFLPGEEEPIITDTQKVVATLNSLCVEMDRRYDLLKLGKSRNIKEYNSKFTSRKLNPNNGHEYLPFIVLVIDEFADLIMTAGKEVELPIARLAQLARAVGIHLIIATQRPSVNIITGVIKANFPARIAFKVTSKVDSRTILDQGGADQLVGKGDMLMSSAGELVRLQCAFLDTPEVETIIDYIGDQRGYQEPFYLPEPPSTDDDNKPGAVSVEDLDEFFEDAARLVVASQSGSTSMIQRRMKLGYNRAGRIMDQLEHFGIVGENQGSKARDVLFQTEMELEPHLAMIKQQVYDARQQSSMY